MSLFAFKCWGGGTTALSASLALSWLTHCSYLLFFAGVRTLGMCSRKHAKGTELTPTPAHARAERTPPMSGTHGCARTVANARRHVGARC